MTTHAPPAHSAVASRMDLDSSMLSPSINLAFFGGTITTSYRTPGESHVAPEFSAFANSSLKLARVANDRILQVNYLNLYL